MIKLDSILKRRDSTWLTKVGIVKAKVFSSSHVRMWESGHKEGWVPKNWCFWIVALEKTLESPLDCEESKPVHPKGNQSWIVTGRTDAEAEAPIFWPPDAKSQLTGKDPDAGKHWGQRRKRQQRGEMAGWHHQLNRHESEQTLGDRGGQGSLAYCSSWGRRVGHNFNNWTPPQSRIPKRVSEKLCLNYTQHSQAIIFHLK